VPLRSVAGATPEKRARSSADAKRVDRVLKRGDHLASFPKLGREVERYGRPGVRELIEAPYRIVYRVRREEVEIIDVFHSAQLPPWER
jgi:plasmid stabilization system protein ParE